MKQEMKIWDHLCFLWGDPRADIRCVQPVDEQNLSDMDHEYEVLEQLSGNRSFCLVAVPIQDWNRDLSPWEAPPAFGNKPFGNGASDTLDFLLTRLIPETERQFGANARYLLGGYSLAALFSLWAGYETDRFAGIAAVSPSVWFPGWDEYSASRTPQAGTVYLSLGDREEKTRNPLMAQVGGCIRAQEKRLKQQDVPCILEWNEGSHFKNADSRTAKGFAWLISNLK